MLASSVGSAMPCACYRPLLLHQMKRHVERHLNSSNDQHWFRNSLILTLALASSSATSHSIVLLADQARSQDTLSTDYPFLSHVGVSCRVSIDTGNGLFAYSYTLRNDAANRGVISIVEIDISRSSNSIRFDTVGLRYAGTGMLLRWFRRDFPPRADRIIPVGIPDLPVGWITSIARTGAVTFDGNASFPGPGQEISGIVMTSKAPPGIRSIVLRPHFNVYRYFPNEEDTATQVPQLTSYQEDSILAAVNFHGLTVAPWDPPADPNPNTLCDTLSSFVRQSRVQRWISEQATADKYTGFLTTVRSQISSGNVPGALLTVRTIVTSSVADSARHFTPEAFALIYYNAVYLEEQLMPNGHHNPLLR